MKIEAIAPVNASNARQQPTWHYAPGSSTKKFSVEQTPIGKWTVKVFEKGKIVHAAFNIASRAEAQTQGFAAIGYKPTD